MSARQESATDLLPARIGELLTTRWLGRRYEVQATCPSTNDLAALRARADAPAGLVIVADAQTGGRGRLGRAWHSPAGENLYLSLLLRPDCAAATLPPLTLLVGVVLAQVVSDVAGVRPRLKWPNDAFLETPGGWRKVAGVLTEMASDRERVRHVVVGVGLNVNTSAFPAELADRATSLRTVTGRPLDRGVLLGTFLNAFEPSFEELLDGGAADCLRRWREFADLPQRCRVERDGRAFSGLALDIDPTGALLVRDDEGRLHRVLSGEVSAE